MSEKVLGCIRVMRVNLNPFARTSIIYEDLYLTPDRVIVARRIGYEKKSTMRRVLDEISDTFRYGGRHGDIEKGRRTDKEYSVMQEKPFLELPPEDILKADEHNYAIPNSDIIRVELGPLEKKHERLSKLFIPRFTASQELSIITSGKYFSFATQEEVKGEKKYRCLLFPSLKGVKLEDYENILREAFPEKLFVKK